MFFRVSLEKSHVLSNFGSSKIYCGNRSLKFNFLADSSGSNGVLNPFSESCTCFRVFKKSSG